MKKTSKDYTFVLIQLFLFLVYFFNVHLFSSALPYPLHRVGIFIFVSGAIVGLSALVQLNTSLSPFPSPLKKGSLVTKGIFGLVRHPIYLSIFCCALGYGIYLSSAYKISISFILLLLFYFKSRYEEKLLIVKYKEYKNYQSKTARFFPGIFPKNK